MSDVCVRRQQRLHPGTIVTGRETGVRLDSKRRWAGEWSCGQLGAQRIARSQATRGTEPGQPLSPRRGRLWLAPNTRRGLEPDDGRVRIAQFQEAHRRCQHGCEILWIAARGSLERLNR